MPENTENQNENEETEVEETEETETEESNENEEWTPPSKEDWDNLVSTLKKVRREARAAAKGAKKDEGEGGTDAAAIEAARAEVEGRYKPMLVRQAARAALVSNGLALPKDKAKEDQAISRAMRLIDMEEVEVGEEGEIEGLSDQIVAIRQEFPELFIRRGGRDIEAGDRGGSGGKPLSSAQKIARQLGA